MKINNMITNIISTRDTDGDHDLKLLVKQEEKSCIIRSSIDTVMFFEQYGADDDEDIISWEQAKDVLVTLGINIGEVIAKRKMRMQRNQCTDPLAVRLHLANTEFVAVKSDELPF